MSPRNSVVETRRTRQRILERGLVIASADGLGGLTIGRLATELAMSKAGVLGHFGTKERLQLEVLDAAAELFAREVPEKVRDVAVGLARLRALCEAWVSMLERNVLPGGCFFAAAATEFDGREGPVRDSVAGLSDLWRRDLRLHVQWAVRAGELPEDTDAEQMVFELVGVMLSLNHFLQLTRDPAAPARARRALGRVLGD
ncbi:TetR/AcrR family transcriptional regulator [Streptomyces sp. NBC_00247]|uniref:TetR/AcrR family transcriptional regulator n=1 Tax=Streptomyces sp. NBC_00247 TaxID=2975689 RepID=UPI002E2C261E|nr:TetR/AcrR family transcriptional regulator [Streptomyces sp. NBC_00247]